MILNRYVAKAESELTADERIGRRELTSKLRLEMGKINESNPCKEIGLPGLYRVNPFYEPTRAA